MANSNVSHSEVKSICDSLECSPAAQMSDSPYGGAPQLTPKRSKSGASGKESTFDAAASGVPGYGGRRAPKAQKQ